MIHPFLEKDIFNLKQKLNTQKRYVLKCWGCFGKDPNCPVCNGSGILIYKFKPSGIPQKLWDRLLIKEYIEGGKNE